jgi:cytochrome c-type biogenesis protein CcmH/NrfG
MVVLLAVSAAQGTTSEEEAKAYFEAGTELNKQQRYDEALTKFSQAIHLSLENNKYHQSYFFTSLALRRGLKAIEEYKQLAAQHPDSPTVHYWLGRLYLQSQSLDDAAREFRNASKLAPQDDHAWISLGHVYYRQGKDAEAMAAYQTANKLAPNVAAVHAGLGNLYLKKKDYPKAQKELEEALRLDESLTEARFNLSLTYEKRGETEKAVKEWQRILEDDPNESGARERLARYYFHTKRYDEAVQEYSMLSQLRPDSPEVFLALGEAQVMSGSVSSDQDERNHLKHAAIEAFQRTLELDPGNIQAREYLDRLDSQVKHEEHSAHGK